MTLTAWIEGIGDVLQPSVICYLIAGVLIGTVIGALPGLSATMGIAILTPVTFWFEPVDGFAMLMGLWNSAIFAGGISAILINTPGTPASITQAFDGYPMYKQGKGGLALGTNVIFSSFSGLFSTACLIFFAFPIAKFTVRFGPTEYFCLALFGLSMMITVSGSDVTKGIITGFLGLCISTVGLDPILSIKRFTFGNIHMLAGISFIPVMIGMFGIGEVLYQIYSRRKTNEADDSERLKNLALGRILPTRKEYKQLAKPAILSSMIATVIGAVPAAGGDISSIICWGQAKKMSKHPEEYGRGSLEGMAVSSCANNGVIGGAMTTMLTLGIPGDAVTAILIGSLMMYGMQPGTQLFTQHADFVINIMLLLIMANLVFLVFGLLTAKASARVLNVKQETVWNAVAILCVVGSFALNNSFFDVLIMFIAGLLGFVFKTMDFPPGPFILGILLGGMLESNLRRALVMSHGSLSIFFTRPITLVLVMLIIFTFLWPFIKRRIDKNKKAAIES